MKQLKKLTALHEEPPVITKQTVRFFVCPTLRHAVEFVFEPNAKPTQRFFWTDKDNTWWTSTEVRTNELQSVEEAMDVIGCLLKLGYVEEST